MPTYILLQLPGNRTIWHIIYGFHAVTWSDGMGGDHTQKSVTTTRAPAMLTTVRAQTGECIHFIVVTISLDS